MALNQDYSKLLCAALASMRPIRDLPALESVFFSENDRNYFEEEGEAVKLYEENYQESQLIMYDYMLPDSKLAVVHKVLAEILSHDSYPNVNDAIIRDFSEPFDGREHESRLHFWNAILDLEPAPLYVIASAVLTLISRELENVGVDEAYSAAYAFWNEKLDNIEFTSNEHIS